MVCSFWYELFERLILMVPKQISFARTRSDAVVKKVDGENYDAHKALRDEHKSTLSNSESV